ncbi:Uma2 family endonuclease [Chryseolinea lacunae]|uniref:Uma2 family endonuclease n=1 Tax=Chryseolinea lacunae TaxID=2801331 RepID=A0ABS1L1W0_9BACT|nr:Uma2 family endonuclease [Chryseolinea lacunae]MBL0744922.1 Uma2 family endonuclease [Chryseolinea lacunae]
MSVETKRKFTQSEYLEAERKASVKSEFYKGEIFAMSGASFNHNVITTNFLVALSILLKNKSYRPFGSDMRLHIPANSLLTYPDISVVCGEIELLDSNFDTMLNPSFVAEVLSPSTRDYDTGGKFTLYRSISTLKEYWTVSSYDFGILKYVKQPDGDWLLSEINELGVVVKLNSLDIEIQTNDLYNGVKF